MAKTNGKSEPNNKQRLRHEIVEMTEGQHRLGLVSADDLRQVTMKMLGRDALPKLAPMSAGEIAAMRQRLGVSQAVFGGLLNVETQTVSKWECGARRPTGTALKLLYVVKTKGLEALR